MDGLEIPSSSGDCCQMRDAPERDGLDGFVAGHLRQRRAMPGHVAAPKNQPFSRNILFLMQRPSRTELEPALQCISQQVKAEN